MPFDTTYYINSGSNNGSAKFIIPGGTDISYYLEPGQLPSRIDSALAGYDSLIYNLQESIHADVKPENTYRHDYGPLIIFLAILFFIIYKGLKNSLPGNPDNANMFGEDEVTEPKPRLKHYLTYYGGDLKFTDAELGAILSKRFPYYRQLNLEYQSIFIHRVQNFMSQKIFKIHDSKAFKEMPVLISAAAVQLTLGLKKYLLPHFEFIHIYPQEFLRVRPILCFLEGNVSGHTIKLSWKHFLAGYENFNNGQNVGLHEFAHALYYQTFVVERNIDKGFKNYYNGFIIDGNKAYDSEKNKTANLYSEYAEKNLQEFWAESVEIFFERPVEMRSHYPQLYASMKSILNQDPINHIPSLGS